MQLVFNNLLSYSCVLFFFFFSFIYSFIHIPHAQVAINLLIVQAMGTNNQNIGGGTDKLSSNSSARREDTAIVFSDKTIRRAFIRKVTARALASANKRHMSQGDSLPVTKQLQPIRASPLNIPQPIRTSPLNILQPIRTSPLNILQPIRTSPLNILQPIRTSPLNILQPIRTSPLNILRAIFLKSCRNVFPTS